MARGVGGQSPSNVQSYLSGVSYPASKRDLVAAAKRNSAPREVMSIIEGFEDTEFGGPSRRHEGVRARAAARRLTGVRAPAHGAGRRCRALSAEGLFSEEALH